MHIYLIRHPEPLDFHGTCYGRRDLEIGPESLAAAAASIRTRMPAHVLENAVIFTSPLSRCRALAEALASPAKPQIAEDLIEMDFGSWEGRAWSGVPRAELDAWARDLWEYRPGGGESASMIAHRWERWLERARSAGSAAIIAVTHAGFIRVALARSGQSSPEEFARGSIAFASVHRIDVGERATASGLAS